MKKNTEALTAQLKSFLKMISFTTNKDEIAQFNVRDHLSFWASRLGTQQGQSTLPKINLFCRELLWNMGRYFYSKYGKQEVRNYGNGRVDWGPDEIEKAISVMPENSYEEQFLLAKSSLRLIISLLSQIYHECNSGSEDMIRRTFGEFIDGFLSKVFWIVHALYEKEHQTAIKKSPNLDFVHEYLIVVLCLLLAQKFDNLFAEVLSTEQRKLLDIKIIVQDPTELREYIEYFPHELEEALGETVDFTDGKGGAAINKNTTGRPRHSSFIDEVYQSTKGLQPGETENKEAMVNETDSFSEIFRRLNATCIGIRKIISDKNGNPDRGDKMNILWRIFFENFKNLNQLGTEGRLNTEGVPEENFEIFALHKKFFKFLFEGLYQKMEEETQFEQIETYLEEHFYDIYENLDFYQYMRGDEFKEDSPNHFTYNSDSRKKEDQTETRQSNDPFSAYKTDVTTENRPNKGVGANKGFNDPFGTANTTQQIDSNFDSKNDEDVFTSQKNGSKKFESKKKGGNEDPFEDPFGEGERIRVNTFGNQKANQTKDNNWMFGGEDQTKKNKMTRRSSMNTAEKDLGIVDEEEKSIKTDSEMEGMKDKIKEFQRKIKHSISMPPAKPKLVDTNKNSKRVGRARESDPKKKVSTRKSHLTPSKIPKAGRASIVGSSEEVFSVFSDNHKIKKQRSKLGSRDGFSGVLGRSRAFYSDMQNLDESRLIMKSRIRQYSRLDNYKSKKQVRSLTVGVRNYRPSGSHRDNMKSSSVFESMELRKKNNFKPNKESDPVRLGNTTPKRKRPNYNQTENTSKPEANFETFEFSNRIAHNVDRKGMAVSSKNEKWNTFEAWETNPNQNPNNDPFQEKTTKNQNSMNPNRKIEKSEFQMNFAGMPIKEAESINRTITGDSKLISQVSQNKKRGLSRGGAKVIIGGQKSRRNQIEAERRMREMSSRIERLEDELHRKMGVERELATVKENLFLVEKTLKNENIDTFRKMMLKSATQSKTDIHTIKQALQRVYDSLDYNREVREALSQTILKRDEFKRNWEDAKLKGDVLENRLNNAKNSAQEFQKLSEELRAENQKLKSSGSIRQMRVNSGTLNKKIEGVRKGIEGLKSNRERLESDVKLYRVNMQKEMRLAVQEMQKKWLEEAKAKREAEKRADKAEAEVLKIKNEMEITKREAELELMKKEKEKKEKDNLYELMQSVHMDVQNGAQRQQAEMEEYMRGMQAELEVHRAENERLADELAEAQHKLLKVDTFLDIESVAMKLQTLEVENLTLNERNARIMEQLVLQREDNQRLKHLEIELEERVREIRVLEKTNAVLVDRMSKREGGSSNRLPGAIGFDSKRDSTGSSLMHRNNNSLTSNDGFRFGENEEEPSEIKNTIPNFYQIQKKSKRAFHSQNTSMNNLKNTANQSLTGTSFINRLDILFRLNEFHQRTPPFAFPKLIHPEYLEQRIFPKGAHHISLFFRTMVEDGKILEHQGFQAKINSQFYVANSSLRSRYSIIIQNQRPEKLSVFTPKIFHDPVYSVTGDEKFETKTWIDPGKQQVIEFELFCPVSNLIYSSSSVFSFFVFSEEEQNVVMNDQNGDIGQFREMIVLPVNVLKFLVFVKQPNFALLNEMALLSQTAIDNSEIQLADLNKIFPNLVLLGFDRIEFMLKKSDLTKTYHVDSIFNGEIPIDDKNILTFGSQIQTPQGTISLIVEFDMDSYSMNFKMFGLANSPIAETIHNTVITLLKNL